MSKDLKIWGVRSGLIGDMVTALPILNFLEKKYPNSYKYFSIFQNCSQAAPLFLNHPLIDKIKISDHAEDFGEDDEKILQSCKVRINTRPEVYDDGKWFHERGHVEESFLMAGFSKEEFDSLSEMEKRPFLSRWFQINPDENQIGIYPFAGYGKEMHRCPTPQWWRNTIDILIKEGYKIVHLGWHQEPDVCDHPNYTKLTHLSFFDQIKIAGSCKATISSDTGTSWIMGAYGFPQVVISTYHFQQGGIKHSSNPMAFFPVNYNDLMIPLFDGGSCDNVPNEMVLKALKSLK